MAVNPKANVDPNNLAPSPTDPSLKNDEALKGVVALINQSEIENLDSDIANLESRMSAAGA